MIKSSSVLCEILKSMFHQAIKMFHFITKTRPCNIQTAEKREKRENISGKFLIFFIYLHKTLIVGTR